jgi:hypothetical protein
VSGEFTMRARCKWIGCRYVGPHRKASRVASPSDQIKREVATNQAFRDLIGHVRVEHGQHDYYGALLRVDVPAPLSSAEGEEG